MEYPILPTIERWRDGATNRLRISPSRLSFRGAEGEEESRKCRPFKAGFLPFALLRMGMTRWKRPFPQAAKGALDPNGSISRRTHRSAGACHHCRWLGHPVAALLAVAFAISLPASQSVAASKRAVAATAYERAERLRVALETRPGASVASYLRVIRAFQLVYRTDPGYTKTPAALAAAAEVYQEMGRQFTSDRYYSKAIAAYQFLAAQYPGGSLAVDALFTVAEIYRRDIENPVAARAAYRQFLKIYPRSQHASEARAEMAEIDAKLVRWPPREPAAARHVSRPPALRPLSRSNPQEADGAMAAVPGPGGLLEVESLRHWVGPNYTRVVIGIAGQVTFSAMHLERPPRLVFDLANTRVSPNLARKVFPVENGFLERIRVAQFSPSVTRVVLDVPQIEDYSVFSLPDPFRLVIDIHGAPKPLVAGAAKPSPGTRGSGLGTRRDDAQTGPLNPSSFPAAPDSEAVPGDAEGFPVQPGGASALPQEGRHASRVPDFSSAREASPSSPLVSRPAAPVPGASPTLTRALGLKIRRIVIDPGHGGHDTGTIGPTGLEEKDVVLGVALRLRKLIERGLGCQVILTRSTDTFIPLEERTAIANEYGSDLFVSIHANASPDPSARGVEVYYLNFTSDPEALQLAARENATSQESVYQLQSLIKRIALSDKIGESRQFAQIADTQLAGYLDEYGDPQKNRGVKKAPFVVLIGANMPSILAEISFLSNPHDERLLRRGSFRQAIALGLYKGIVRYANSLGTIRVAQRATLQPIRHHASSF
jgi:N-acetylmuramoyl-L-alanine amidase